MHKSKCPLARAFAFLLAEWTGLAYVPQAAETPAGVSLLAPPGATQVAPPLLTHKSKCPLARASAFLLAEWTGLEPATPGVTGRYSNQLNYHS